jgi:multidrug efflux system outer membrane protein
MKRVGSSGLTAASLLAVLLVAGCAIGPNYHRSEDLPDAAAFRGEEEPAEETFVDELPWWAIFDDPVLVDLTQEALENNRDLALAVARVEKARSLVGVARSELMPQIGYEGQAGRSERSENIGVPGTTRNFFYGFLDLAWEIDVWGRIRRSTEAARAELYASEAFERGVRLSLITGVAQAYFELCELDRELDIAVRTVASFERSRDLFVRQFEGGKSSRLAVERAEGALAQTEAIVPELEARIVAKENELSVLLGRTAGPIERGGTLTQQRQPPAVPAGLPVDLLERRPDLVEAEQVLVAANARVGESIGFFLPRIGLTSFFGHQSNELSEFLGGGSRAWSIAGSFTGPIFQGGRLWSFFQASKAEREAAAQQYEQSVLNALREVSDALVAWERLQTAREAQARSVMAYDEAVGLAFKRYWGGLASYFEVLQAQELLFPAENRLAQIELARLRALVQLYKALGGGWSVDELPDEAPPSSDPMLDDGNGTQDEGPPAGASAPVRDDAPTGS